MDSSAAEIYLHSAERTSGQRNAPVTGAMRLMRALVKETPLSQRAIPVAAAFACELDRPIKDRAMDDKYEQRL